MIPTTNQEANENTPLKNRTSNPSVHNDGIATRRTVMQKSKVVTGALILVALLSSFAFLNNKYIVSESISPMDENKLNEPSGWLGNVRTPILGSNRNEKKEKKRKRDKDKKKDKRHSNNKSKKSKKSEEDSKSAKSAKSNDTENAPNMNSSPDDKHDGSSDEDKDGSIGGNSTSSSNDTVSSSDNPSGSNDIITPAADGNTDTTTGDTSNAPSQPPSRNESSQPSDNGADNAGNDSQDMAN